MPDNSDKLEQILIKDDLFWEFYSLFSNLCKRQHPDLPRLKTPSFNLDPFKLADIFYYCKENNEEPRAALLMEAVEFRSPVRAKIFEDLSDTFSQHLVDCFNSAMQRIRIDKHTQELFQESADTAREHKRPRKTTGARKFSPQRYGGKELCIVVSYKKAGNSKTKKLATALTHRAGIRYPGRRYSYETPLDWYENNHKGFNNHTYKLREKAKSEGWWDNIPKD